VPERLTRHDGEEILMTGCTGRNPEMMGVITFPLDRLLTWRLDVGVIAAAAASSLGLTGAVTEVEPGWAWSLGIGRVAGRPRAVFLATGLVGDGAPSRAGQLLARIGGREALVLVPFRPGPVGEVPVVPLGDLLRLEDGGLVFDADLMALALPPAPLFVSETQEVTYRSGSDAAWNQVKVWLVDGDTVRIVLPGRPPRSFTAAELGLTNARSRDRRRTKGWAILEALCDGHGSCSWRAGGCASYDAFKVQVSVLGKTLREFLCIDGSPFHPTSPREGLRAVFEAGPLPEPDVYVGEDRWMGA